MFCNSWASMVLILYALHNISYLDLSYISSKSDMIFLTRLTTVVAVASLSLLGAMASLRPKCFPLDSFCWKSWEKLCSVNLFSIAAFLGGSSEADGRLNRGRWSVPVEWLCNDGGGDAIVKVMAGRERSDLWNAPEKFLSYDSPKTDKTENCVLIQSWIL